MFDQSHVLMMAMIHTDRFRLGYSWEPEHLYKLVKELREYWRQLDAQWQENPLLEQFVAGTDEGLEEGICFALDPSAEYREFSGDIYLRSKYSVRQRHELLEPWLVRIEQVAAGRKHDSEELAAITHFLVNIHRGFRGYCERNTRIRRFAA